MARRAAVFHDPDHDYQRMGKWVHALGFRGHFGTKSRRYSITLGALRRARSRWQALATQTRHTDAPLDTRDLEQRLLTDAEAQTTQVIGNWTYIGTGWRDHTEEAIALAAADRAREYDLWKAQRRKGRTELLAWTGLRWAEARAMRFEDVMEVPTPGLLVRRSQPEGHPVKATKG